MASSLPQPTDARAHRRLYIELEVTLHSDSNFYMGLTQNLSHGGVFVATYLVQPLGTQVELVVRLATQTAPLKLKGRVRWVREFAEGHDGSPGMGIEFEDMSEEDVRAILRHPATMIGSDGLPNDPRPHPRLWGTFPRVLGHYCRDGRLFPIQEAVRKMTGLTAQRFRLHGRGLIQEGYFADLVLFDPKRVRDEATFADPVRAAAGIEAVWVNGVLSYKDQKGAGVRAGRFLPRNS